LGGRKGIWSVKKEWWGAGVVICLERGADVHTAELMPLPLTVSCFSKIHTGFGFTFLVPAHPSSPGQRADKRVCARVVFALSKAMDAPDDDEYRRMLTIILASIFAGTILLALVAIVVVAVWRRRAGRPGKATIVANHGLAAAQRRTTRPRIGHGSKRFEIANETAPKNIINTDV